MDIKQAVAALASRGLGVRVSMTPEQRIEAVQNRMQTASLSQAQASAGGFKGAVLSGTTTSEGRELALACLDACLARIKALEPETVEG